jgi:hypothetical protein
MRIRSHVGLALVTVAAVVFLAGYAAAGAVAAGYAAAGAVAPTFVSPAGTTRYAMVARGPLDGIATTSSIFVDITGLSVIIGIPSGKHAELIVTFSGEVNTCDAMYVRAYTQLQWAFGGGADSHSFTFFKKDVGPGSHTVAMQWRGLSTCDHQFMDARSMIVTANIH